MKNYAYDILDAISNSILNNDFYGMKIFTVKTINPLVFTYLDVEIGTTYGDTIYIHPLFNNENIALDVETLSEVQSFTSSTAYNSPTFEAAITGTIPDFIQNFYNFYLNWHSTYILNAGDLVAAFEMGNNTFLILQKVAIDVVSEEETDEEQEEG